MQDSFLSNVASLVDWMKLISSMLCDGLSSRKRQKRCGETVFLRVCLLMWGEDPLQFFTNTQNWQKCQYWHHWLHYMKTKKNPATKFYPTKHWTHYLSHSVLFSCSKACDANIVIFVNSVCSWETLLGGHPEMQLKMAYTKKDQGGRTPYRNAVLLLAHLESA